ncbi:hypothetical protein AL542_02230 [Grimontia hollisae]|uniref:Lipoprotein n=1 Tax=Grimontia hollisae CIP 101886 TaxID=675812 RepID=D0I5D8_GRIHO|nr:hypothetical protein [Grimontia hollisae]AMG29276.1 hypothetical protein AL542_02230 [Grimontia hollisae]EEY73102.1 hypothetical protein VHA_000955 [Grimontia hollisae CIP 101886]MDF2185173.1 hypothetical protein [Grimontia hollisae]STO77805.1 Uncharacterised protein [Grimontia hollisae]STQ76195.1 Uncharacterised protein [Grimontia hollisae]
MKKAIASMAIMFALTGCEEANEAIDKAQEVATSAAESIQEKMDSVDLGELNLDSLESATAYAKALTESMEEALRADLTDADVVAKVQEKVANSYACLIDATSENTAEQLLNKFMSAINDEDAQSLIEKGVEKAKAAKACVM